MEKQIVNKPMSQEHGFNETSTKAEEEPLGPKSL